MRSFAGSTGFILGLHLLPGVIFTALLFAVMPAIKDSGIDLFLTQIILITIFLLGFEVLIAHVYCKVVEEKSLWSSLRALRSVEFNWRALGAAIVWAALSVGVMKGYFAFAGPFIEWFRDLPLLKLPSWHYQNLDMPNYPSPFKTLLLVLMLGTNVFAEEVYFRGFLLERLKSLGKFAFVVNGVLFIAYHFFQIPVAYPLIPFGLLLSGYYVIFRNVWGCMLIHLILNLAL